MDAKRPNYTIVTVAHAPQEPFLEMQANSLNMYLDTNPSFVSSIVIVDGAQSSRLNWRGLVRRYGQLAARVRFIDISEFGALPHDAAWYRQQVLKLLVARKITTPRYIILDSKNHLVNPLFRDAFETADSRLMYSSLRSYRHHSFRHLVENACRYFGIDAAAIGAFMPTVTPFVVSTHLVRELLDHVERRERVPFAHAFLGRPASYRLTEFGLYAAYLIFSRGGFSALYDMRAPGFPIVWSEINISAKLAAAQKSPVFAVHRSAYRTLRRPAREALAAFWHEHRLFRSKREAEVFIASCVRFWR
jgi:hypothetical protein